MSTAKSTYNVNAKTQDIHTHESTLRVNAKGDESSTSSEISSIRFDRITKVGQRAVQDTLKHLTYEKLMSCYPGIASTPSGRRGIELAVDQIKNFFETAALVCKK